MWKNMETGSDLQLPLTVTFVVYVILSTAAYCTNYEMTEMKDLL